MNPQEALRYWQHSESGSLLWEMEYLKTAAVIEKRKPEMVVQMEGLAYLDHFPSYGYYYHVSEHADRKASGYSVEAHMTRLPFRDHSVDLLIVGHALELNQDIAMVLTEIDRVLSSTGCVLIHAWAGNWLGAQIPSVFSPVKDLDMRCVVWSSLMHAMRAHHWEVVDKMAWVTPPSIRMLMQHMREQMVQPMSLVIEREELAYIGNGVLKYE